MNAPRAILGIVTLMLGALYILFGSAFLFGAYKMAEDQGQWKELAWIFSVFFGLIGVVVVMLGASLAIAGGDYSPASDGGGGWQFRFRCWWRSTAGCSSAVRTPERERPSPGSCSCAIRFS